MTLLNRRDGDDAGAGASYLELVEWISSAGALPGKDLEQLWRRIVFFICVSNVDDHLRNHAFLLHPKGWRLSPAYDLNPVAAGEGLRLNISESDNAQDLELALSVTAYFRIKKSRAETIIRNVIESVNKWRAVATTLCIPSGEQDRMSRAFRVAETRKKS
jgi:serine/threonine-protein kinase HipA